MVNNFFIEGVLAKKGGPRVSSHGLSLIVFLGREGCRSMEDQGSAPISFQIK